MAKENLNNTHVLDRTGSLRVDANSRLFLKALTVSRLVLKTLTVDPS
jgi:hypothetical protein